MEKKIVDLSDLNGNIFDWELETYQLGRGLLTGRFCVGKASNIFVMHTSFSNAVEQMGIAPKNHYNFAITADNKTHFNWRGNNITPNSIMVFPESGELNAITNEYFEVFLFSLNSEYLNELIENSQFDKLKDVLTSSEFFQANEYLLNLLRYYVSEFLLNPLDYQYDSLFGNLLLKIVGNSCYIDRSSHISVKEYSIKTFLTYFQRIGYINFSIRRFCEETKISQRTLQYAFIDRYNMTPKAYINRIRLNMVYNKIVSEGDEKWIKDIAYSYDFKHLGQFTSDFRQLFLKKPSELLIK